MDLSAPKIAEKEQVEAPNVVERKAQTLANQIKKSKHFIAFTGAGISTSAGKLQYRGTDLRNLIAMQASPISAVLMGIGR
jgi:hypothetical protein